MLSALLSSSLSSLLTVVATISCLNIPLSLAYDPGADDLDFYYDPLLPREGDALHLEAQINKKSLKQRLKPEDIRWYYRELGTSRSDFRLIGTGLNFRYDIAKGFQDGYFNLTVVCCCTDKGERFQLDTEKYIRFQRQLQVQVRVNHQPLPGNNSEMIIAVGRSTINLECRIRGMPTRFQFLPPLGVTCRNYKTRNKLRHVAVIRRRCIFRPGPLVCTASNDVSRVRMVHTLRGAVVPKTSPPPKGLVTAKPVLNPHKGSNPFTTAKMTSFTAAVVDGPKKPSKGKKEPKYTVASKVGKTPSSASVTAPFFPLLSVLTVTVFGAT